MATKTWFVGMTLKVTADTDGEARHQAERVQSAISDVLSAAGGTAEVWTSVSAPKESLAVEQLVLYTKDG